MVNEHIKPIIKTVKVGYSKFDMLLIRCHGGDKLLLLHELVHHELLLGYYDDLHLPQLPQFLVWYEPKQL
jgi:hypothetical protein